MDLNVQANSNPRPVRKAVTKKSPPVGVLAKRASHKPLSELFDARETMKSIGSKEAKSVKNAVTVLFGKKPEFAKNRVNVTPTKIAQVSDKPRLLMPEVEEQEATLAEKANRKFELEENFVSAPSTLIYEGVPISEELDPSRVEEYCEREPCILTNYMELNRSPRFGTIDARFKAMAMPYRDKMMLITDAKAAMKENGAIPADFPVGTMANVAIIERLQNGESLDQEYQEAMKKAEIYMEAFRTARALYNKTIRADYFKIIGNYEGVSGTYCEKFSSRHSQLIMKQGNKPVSYDPSYFTSDFDQNADEALKEAAKENPQTYIKAISLMINNVGRQLKRQYGSQWRPRLN